MIFIYNCQDFSGDFIKKVLRLRIPGNLPAVKIQVGGFACFRQKLRVFAVLCKINNKFAKGEK
jgi:hypothetical protein